VTVYRAGSDDEQPNGARHRAAQSPDVDRILGVHNGQHIRESSVRRSLEGIKARESYIKALEERIRQAEDRARQAQHEARVAELRLAEARDASPREVARTSTGGMRADRAIVARDHEVARMKAKFINGGEAGPDLAERLQFAHRQSGKVSLDALGAAVGYSKATLSKVFNGKMAPTWALVRKLGAELKVPQTLVMQEWLPLWIAADTHRQKKPDPARGESPEAAGHSCTKCGAWVVDVARHTGWHMAQEPGGRPPDAESMGAGWNGESQELTLLREALGQDPEE
jgi:hypothetical protein